jgi:small subunit ribosomal protein S6
MVNKLISDQGGKITFEEFWGKHKLAYRVDGFRHGYYHLVEFDLEGPKLGEINNRLRLSNEVLRHQIIKKKRKTAADLEEEARIKAKIAERRKAEDSAEETKKAAAKPVADDKRADLKDFDEELDKIIDASNLL